MTKDKRKEIIRLRDKWRIVKRLMKHAEQNEILQIKKKYDFLYKVMTDVDDKINELAIF